MYLHRLSKEVDLLQLFKKNHLHRRFLRCALTRTVVSLVPPSMIWIWNHCIVSIPAFSENNRRKLKLELEAIYQRVTDSKNNNASNLEVQIDGFVKFHPLINWVKLSEQVVFNCCVCFDSCSQLFVIFNTHSLH